MRKLLVTILVGATIATAAPADAGTTWRWNECRFQGRDGKAGWNRDEVKTTIRCAAPKFGVSVSKALAIADRESDFQARATNPASGACGIFQHIPQYFPDRLSAVPDRYRKWSGSCYDARSNVLAALRLVDQVGWGPWT